MWPRCMSDRCSRRCIGSSVLRGVFRDPSAARFIAAATGEQGHGKQEYTEQDGRLESEQGLQQADGEEAEKTGELEGQAPEAEKFRSARQGREQADERPGR